MLLQIKGGTSSIASSTIFGQKAVVTLLKTATRLISISKTLNLKPFNTYSLMKMLNIIPPKKCSYIVTLVHGWWLIVADITSNGTQVMRH